MENAKYVPDPDVVSASGDSPDGGPSANLNLVLEGSGVRVRGREGLAEMFVSAGVEEEEV